MKEGGGEVGVLGDPGPDVERRFQPSAAVQHLDTACDILSNVIMLFALKIQIR